jgi:hypothetical protein
VHIKSAALFRSLNNGYDLSLSLCFFTKQGTPFDVGKYIKIVNRIIKNAVSAFLLQENLQVG